MSVSIKVNGTDNTLVHKGSNGIAKNTAPDVCKTPSPGGPVPMPYPVIVSMSSDLDGGTTTVKADGGNSCAIKGSNFSRCSGDEAGTAGGVKSNTNMKEATWILYSFDVKMEGQNACRKSDKMMMNHENTICMSGVDQIVLRAMVELARACDEAVNRDWDNRHPNGPKHDNCTADAKTGRKIWNKKKRVDEPEPVQVALGREKEACVNQHVPDTVNRTQQQPFGADGSPLPKGTTAPGASIPDFVGHGSGPVTSASEVTGIIDLKFPCPSEANKPGRWREGQLEKYQEVFPNCQSFNIVSPAGIF